jgi:hypothetical protein
MRGSMSGSMRGSMRGSIGGSIGGSVGGSVGGRCSTPTSEPFLVLALPPSLRYSALGRWRGIVINCVKLRIVHINVNINEARGITFSRIGDRLTERYRHFFITDCHTLLHKVSRNPASLKNRAFDCPLLRHTESNSRSCTRNNLYRFIHVSRARLAASESKITVRTVFATTRSRRRPGRRDKTWNTGRSSRRPFGWTFGRTFRRGNGRSSRGNSGRRCSGRSSGCSILGRSNGHHRHFSWRIISSSRGFRGRFGTGRHRGSAEPRINTVTVTIVLGRGGTGNETRWVVGDTTFTD